MLLERQGDTDGALGLYERTLKIYTSVFGSYHERGFLAVGVLGLIPLTWPSSCLCSAKYRHHSSQTELIQRGCYFTLRIYMPIYQSPHEPGLDLCDQIIDVCVNLHSDVSQQVAAALNLKAVFAKGLTDFKMASELYERAYKIYEALHGASSLLCADCLFNLGTCHMNASVGVF